MSQIQIWDNVQINKGSKQGASGVVTWIGEKSNKPDKTVASVRCLCGETFTIGLNYLTIIKKGEGN